MPSAALTPTPSKQAESSFAAGSTAMDPVAQSASLATPAREDVAQVQSAWAAVSVVVRLRVLARARGLLAEAALPLADAISTNLDRTRADTLAAEVLPLLAACRFLEQEAGAILRTRRLGRRGLPFWLAGIWTEVQRVPFGRVLVIGPANYPLLLPGVQTLQALAAGNAVTWKPGKGGRPVALIVAQALASAGLPNGLLRVTDDTISAAEAELETRYDKIVFTGSSTAGSEILRRAAATATPVVAELSGCDAAVVLPSADPGLVFEALTFGMRLNGSATCMAPRRLILVGDDSSDLHEPLLADLRDRFAEMPVTPLALPTLSLVRGLLADAELHGANILGTPGTEGTAPILILNATPAMQIAQTDVFAPVLSVFRVPSAFAAARLNRACPFGLTATIFGAESAARTLARTLDVGTVLINDLIVPTADPRIPFTGRGASGFGSTRGREGLLELTLPKVVAVRRNKNRRHLAPATAAHEALFTGLIAARHARTLRERLIGTRAMLQAAMRIGKSTR